MQTDNLHTLFITEEMILCSLGFELRAYFYMVPLTDTRQENKQCHINTFLRIQPEFKLNYIILRYFIKMFQENKNPWK